MSQTDLRLSHPWHAALTRFWRSVTPREPEPTDVPFDALDVACLHDVAPGQSEALDAQTWRDLLLDRYLDKLSGQVSIFGRQVLYRRLRGGQPENLTAGRERIGQLVREGDALDRLHGGLRSLRHAQVEVAQLLFDPGWQASAPPAWLTWYWLLPLGLVASIAAALLVSPAAWIVTFAVLYQLVRTHLGHERQMEAWRGSTHSLQMLLRVVSLLDGSGLPLSGDVAGRGARAGRIGRSLARSLTATALPDAASYGDWFMLAAVRHYYKTQAWVARERDFLRECYLLCADLEADVALARHLRTMPVWCWVEQGAARTLALEEGVHPLLEEARGLSIALDGKGAFISGQNGVGKSTLLRMLGLNLAAARAFGFCYAQAASLPALPVVASLQNEDSLLDGHSLYIAELARARELLATAASGRPAVLLIDEIFRGTNHEESVAAAAAVLDELAERSLVVVSSHNLVLGPLLAHRLQAWRIVREKRAGALRLEPGLLAQTNGVSLLAAQGFSSTVQAKAARVAQWLARQDREGAGTALAAPSR